MRNLIQETLEIPEEVSCTYEHHILTCKKEDQHMSRRIQIPGVKVELKDKKIIFTAQKGNKKDKKIIFSYVKHLKNMFNGLAKPYQYKLEACNVHFPMTFKVEGNQIVINNFLGEKTPRHAKILQGVKIEVKGQTITLTSHDKESAGQTAANLETATKVRNRDRRIFQDGLYITEKPGDKQ